MVSFITAAEVFGVGYLAPEELLPTLVLTRPVRRLRRVRVLFWAVMQVAELASSSRTQEECSSSEGRLLPSQSRSASVLQTLAFSFRSVEAFGSLA